MNSFDSQTALAQLSRVGAQISHLWQHEECVRLEMRGSAEARRELDGPTALDREANALIVECLASVGPRVPVVSEEAPLPIGVSDAEQFWLVDPIDGSHNAALGFPAFTVSIALVRGKRPIFGWVYDPSRRVAYHASRGAGASMTVLDGGTRRLLAPRCDVPLARAVVGVIGGRRQTASMAALSRAVGKIRVVSCSSLEICYVATGVLDAFVDVSSTGYERACDIAAATVILEEVGGQIQARNGAALSFGPAGMASIAERQPIIATGREPLLRDLTMLLEKEGINQ